MASPDHKKTYHSETENYDRLINREDWQGNILREIERICPPDGLDVLDLGAGTGRFETLLAGRAASLTALDLFPAMLGIAREKLVDLECGELAPGSRRSPSAASEGSELRPCDLWLEHLLPRRLVP